MIMDVRRHALGVVVSLLALTALLAGCAPTSPPAPTTPPPAAGSSAANEVEPSPSATPEPPGLEDFDFGNTTWKFRPGGAVAELQYIDLVDSKAVVESATYELGEVVLAELGHDDRIDAAVQITRLDGNAIDQQWYLWIATDDGPVQSTLPVARVARCGTAVHAVTAVPTGGVEIQETRRGIGQDSLPCASLGADQRTRVVVATQALGDDAWWPMEIDDEGAPAGFGGLCPIAADYEPVDYHGALHAVPDASRDDAVLPGESWSVFGLEPWPIYGESFPDWVLIGVLRDGGGMSCAWGPT